MDCAAFEHCVGYCLIDAGADDVARWFSSARSVMSSLKVKGVYNHVREPIYTIAALKNCPIRKLENLKGKAINAATRFYAR
jgi:hypothetical protein